MACLATVSARAEEFSFAVASDVQGSAKSWESDLKEAAREHAALIVVAGDMVPERERKREFDDVFAATGGAPVLLPVPGNHELDRGAADYVYLRDHIIAAIPGAKRFDTATCNYYFDYKNCRFIAVDAYTAFGTHGVINARGRVWVEQTIVGAPPAIEDIFVFFHEPAFPSGRHVGDSFDEDPALRDAFWQMLVRHKDKVRAVFAGHTHYRAHTLKDGMWEINAGSAGDAADNGMAMVRVAGRKASAQLLASPNGADGPFRVVDTVILAPSE